MDEWIRLADGTLLENTYIVDLGNDLIAVYSRSVQTAREAWSLFGDPDRTQIIHSDQYQEKRTWMDYTEPQSIQSMPGGGMCVTLGKGAV